MKFRARFAIFGTMTVLAGCSALPDLNTDASPRTPGVAEHHAEPAMQADADFQDVPALPDLSEVDPVRTATRAHIIKTAISVDADGDAPSREVNSRSVDSNHSDRQKPVETASPVGNEEPKTVIAMETVAQEAKPVEMPQPIQPPEKNIAQSVQPAPQPDPLSAAADVSAKVETAPVRLEFETSHLIPPAAMAEKTELKKEEASVTAMPVIAAAPAEEKKELPISPSPVITLAATSMPASSVTKAEIAAPEATAALANAACGASCDTAASAQPMEYWDIRIEDRSLKALFQAWSKKAAWQLSWELPNDYSLNSSASIPGDFEKAIEAVVNSMQGSEKPFKVIFYEGNRVMRVVGKGEQ